MSDKPDAITYTVETPKGKAGMRLDRFLADCLSSLSRTRIKALIKAGMVTAGQSPPLKDPARRVRAADVFTVRVPPPTPAVPVAQAIGLDVVFEDGDLIIIDKPAGLVVHPSPGHPEGTLVNALLAHCGGGLSGIGGVTRPGIVHRLDKDTSGLMVAAKNDMAHLGLSEQFAERRIDRAYYAVVWGAPYPPQGGIEGNIGRSPANRKKMTVLKSGGKPALTRYRLVKPLGAAASLVECRLATGRTHQIRVHMNSRGWPVIGDPLYGGAGNRLKGASDELREFLKSFGRQALHAYMIGFSHPQTSEKMKFGSKLPKEINELCRLLEL
ncbi:MAG: RluA family pseudouridine synthase [Rhodospirillales bacterium]